MALYNGTTKQLDTIEVIYEMYLQSENEGDAAYKVTLALTDLGWTQLEADKAVTYMLQIRQRDDTVG